MKFAESIDIRDCSCRMSRMTKQNFFNTLNESLESEGLLHTWDCCKPAIQYGQTVSWTFDDGTRYGHFISIYRNERGRYERPTHYARG
jgi:hypothetical protein